MGDNVVTIGCKSDASKQKTFCGLYHTISRLYGERKKKM